MDIYLLTLCGGFGGLLLMALIGLGHQAHGHGTARGNGHAPTHGGQHHSGGGVHKGGTPHHGRGNILSGGNFLATLLTLLSPRVAFTLLLGFGVTGILFRPLLGASVLLPFLAAAGGVAFEAALIKPLWNFLFRFASEPAGCLDSVLLEEGEAVTNFDANGHGLIALQLDGQHRQLLGTLCAEERADGAPRVRAGERLFVRAVDARRNTCTVSRLR